jgi:hypothetical protein
MVPETPMRLLIKQYPDLAELVFNNCIRKVEMTDENNDPLASPKTCLIMDYEFIDDAFLIEPPEKDQLKGTMQCNS